jgi:hypothetical protein
MGKSILDESCWFLYDYQRGQIPLFVSHIVRGLHELAADPRALLIVSGGKTRGGLGARSEGSNYAALAEHIVLRSMSMYSHINGMKPKSFSSSSSSVASASSTASSTSSSSSSSSSTAASSLGPPFHGVFAVSDSDAVADFDARQPDSWLYSPLLADRSLLDRIVPEEHARDSLDNLMYSTCRFREITGRMPGISKSIYNLQTVFISLR